MSDIHIDDFYRDTARILVALYNQFPRKTTLYVEDVAGPDKPDEFGLHSPRHLACLHTILWLAQSDYVRYETLIRQEAVDQIVLSHKGFITDKPRSQFCQRTTHHAAGETGLCFGELYSAGT